jgi:hypothetical protein
LKNITLGTPMSKGVAERLSKFSKTLRISAVIKAVSRLFIN